jgi:hypothetical protein
MALPGISAPALCTTFRSQAQKIWVDLSRAHRRGWPRSEETITENFLDEIQDAHPQQIFTCSFNKREEGYTGADWEWWLTDDRTPRDHFSDAFGGLRRGTKAAARDCRR